VVAVVAAQQQLRRRSQTTIVEFESLGGSKALERGGRAWRRERKKIAS
jgi:hypothetical protein